LSRYVTYDSICYMENKERQVNMDFEKSAQQLIDRIDNVKMNDIVQLAQVYALLAIAKELRLANSMTQLINGFESVEEVDK
jgi:hypothetical protein